ncbi:MAG: enoyl-CoA hydratase/isomerase family protein [Gammaproteobacteria bacterium]|nr:enoyl-CoA hydratase/isomerase family protein [Gammaproteobacteria bacterium]
MRHWRIETDDDNIAWLHFDHAGGSTNVLSGQVLEALDEVLAELEQLAPRGMILVSDKRNGFVAGADIKEFTTLSNIDEATVLVRRGQSVFDRLAALPFPTVAVVHGFALGGGMELALACRHRVVEDDPATQLGLPEVKLGVHPGFGGTVRLPRLVGAPAAMDMMLSGRSVRARPAARTGLADHCVPRRHLKEAARELVLKAPPAPRAHGWPAWLNHRLARPIFARYLERQLAKKAPRGHYPAPWAILNLWKDHFDDPQRQMTREAESFARQVLGSTAQNLVRVFFLQDRLKGLGKIPRGEPRPRFEHVHVIGGGVMGGDIAAWCALKGMRVSVQDTQPQALARVLQRAHGLFRKQLHDPRAVQAAMDRLMPDATGDGLAGADVVIEAIFEDLAAKQELFRAIEPRVRSDALLASNTSSIPIEQLAQALKEPSRLVGLHFFNPVAKMQLVEIVAGTQSGERERLHAAAFGRGIGRLPLPVNSRPGFLVNRVLMPYLMEAAILAGEGVNLSSIDKAATDFGMPMGPIQLADTVGLDICLHVGEILAAELGGEVPAALRTKVDAGDLGLKSGKGFYAYRGRDPVRGSDKAAAPKDLADRLLLRLLNESVACLRESVVADPDLLDAGIVFGTGFAPFRGGPMNHIRQLGVATVRDKLERMAASHGERFAPDPGWSSLKL